MNLRSWFLDLSLIVDAKSNKLAGFAPKIYTRGQRVFEDQPGDPDQWEHARRVMMRSIRGIEKHNKTLKTVAALTTAAMFGSFGLLYLETQKSRVEFKWTPYNEAGQMVNAIVPSSPTPPDLVKSWWTGQFVEQMARKSPDAAIQTKDKSIISSELCGGAAISTYNAFVTKRPAATQRSVDGISVKPTVSPDVYVVNWREQDSIDGRVMPERAMYGEFKVAFDPAIYGQGGNTSGLCVVTFQAGPTTEFVR